MEDVLFGWEIIFIYVPNFVGVFAVVYSIVVTVGSVVIVDSTPLVVE